MSREREDEAKKADWEMLRREEKRRDLFAAHAMAAMMRTGYVAEKTVGEVARRAFSMADAMLAASEK